MKCKNILIFMSIAGIALQSGITSEVVFAQESAKYYPKQGRRPHPPQEAFAACVDAEEGGSCSFAVPHRNLSGSCQTKHHGFLCVPDRAPPHLRTQASPEHPLENEE